MTGSSSLDDADYLPYDQPADALADAARLLVLVRSLVADARFARSAQLTMTEWSDFLCPDGQRLPRRRLRLRAAGLVAVPPENSRHCAVKMSAAARSATGSPVRACAKRSRA